MAQSSKSITRSARSHLPDVEAAFDSGLLESWVGGEAQQRLTAVRERVDAAVSRLAALPREGARCPRWLSSALGEHADAIALAGDA